MNKNVTKRLKNIYVIPQTHGKMTEPTWGGEAHGEDGKATSGPCVDVDIVCMCRCPPRYSLPEDG